MPHRADIVSKLRKHLKDNRPEIFEIFIDPISLQPDGKWNLKTTVDKSYYSDEQWDEVEEKFEELKKEAGIFTADDQ